MISSFSKFALAKSASAVAMALALVACGGGGGSDGASAGAGGGASSNGNGAGVGLVVNGTVARGEVLPNSTVRLSCANGSELSAVTNSAGVFETAQTAVVYPCIGTATSGGITYRSMLFANSTANFTPLTDLLVHTVLAASVSGSTSLTSEQFLAKIRNDSTFAADVSSSVSVVRFRNAVLNVIKAQLIASGKSEAEATAILAAASNFESQPFVGGSALDKVLDATAAYIQNADGSLRAAILALIKAAGDLLTPPSSGGATGGTGGTGSTGSSGGTGG